VKILDWITSSGIVQGVIIGAALSFLTAWRVLDLAAEQHTLSVNGWKTIRESGRPSNGWLVRAALQKALPAVNVFEEAAYFSADTDSAGRRLSGRHCYRIHFPPGQLPPTGAFWSLTATDPAGYMKSSDAGRCSVTSHSSLIVHADGAVDVILHASEPSRNVENWLPTPDGPFKVMLRVYLPGESILDGSYAVPAVTQVM